MPRPALRPDWAAALPRLAARLTMPTPDSCWEWQGYRSPFGYGRIRVGARKELAHRVAFAAANGHPAPGMLIRHKCDNPPCCNPAHLETGTHADNAQDKVARGRLVVRSGESHHAAKLSIEQVREIRLAPSTTSHRALARTYSVSRPTISAIRAGRQWKDHA